MKDDKGFTLIETLIAISYITFITVALSLALSSVYSDINFSNTYKDADDTAFDNIQSDSTKVDKTISDTSDGKIVDHDTGELKISGRNDTIKVKTSYSKKNAGNDSVEYRSFNPALGTQLKYVYFVESSNGNITQQESLKAYEQDYGIDEFKDLPEADYTGMSESNAAWGKWSFIGWSTQSKEESATDEKGNTSYYKVGDPKYLITNSNFETFVNNAELYNKSNSDYYTIYATYIFSKDIPQNDADKDLLKVTGDPLRTTQDLNNLQRLADTAAYLIKKNGIASLSNDFTEPALNALEGDYGLEILHFRQYGWPVLANTEYHSANTDLHVIKRPDKNPFTVNPLYNKITKIGSGTKFTGGYKNGFLYKMFMGDIDSSGKKLFSGIEYDLNKVGNYDTNDWRGVNYSYHCLLFSNAIIDTRDSDLYSLYMKIDKETKKVEVFVATVIGTSNNYKFSIFNNGLYYASASFA